MNRLIFEIIGGIVLIAGTWIGGQIYRDGVESRKPPKNQTINNYQTTENRNTSIQESSQAQITIVTPMTNFNVNYNGKTNIVVQKSSITNRTRKTNY